MTLYTVISIKGGKNFMGDEWREESNTTSNQPKQDDIDRRLEDIRKKVTQGAIGVQQRFRRAVTRAGDYWTQAQAPLTPRRATDTEELRIRQLINTWSKENWRVARDLGSYIDIISLSDDEVWETTVETRWEKRSMEVVTEPYTGTVPGRKQPLLPVWDYELPAVSGLKAPETRTRLQGLDDNVACTTCNSTGHVLCSNCTGRGWIVCPQCKGRTKKRCTTCRGRGYVADWTPGEKKSFIKRQTENVTNSVGNKIYDVFDTIRQQGVPIPNPADSDPADKGRTIPCPDCINGEMDCECRNGKIVCPVCEGARMAVCTNCAGTGRLVRHREIARSFDLRTQTHFLGNCPIGSSQLLKAEGDLIYSAEVDDTLYPEAPPDNVPLDIWQRTVELVRQEAQLPEKPGVDQQVQARPTLQVVELIRIPYIQVQYRFAGQDYVLYIYDGEGKEKFYAERFPARWERVERLFKAISTDLLPAGSPQSVPSSPLENGYSGDTQGPGYTPEDPQQIDKSLD
jgi:hypothetical protein